MGQGAVLRRSYDHKVGADEQDECAGKPAPADAGRIVDALRASADQEFNIAERVAAKARQAFVLAAAVFTVAQTVAFGNFEAAQLTSAEKTVLLALAIASVVCLGLAARESLRADDVVDSRDLSLDVLEQDLNAAYAGDPDALGRLGGYYLGVVRSRRTANDVRRRAYKRGRTAANLSLVVTTTELIVALIARI